MATLTVYPDANVETTTVDGTAGVNPGSDRTFAQIRTDAGTAHQDATASDNGFRLRCGSSSNTYDRADIGFFLFDTSAIPDAATISAATFSVYTSSIDSTLNLYIALVAGNPQSDTDLVNSDYNFGTRTGTTHLATDIKIDAFTNNGYTNFTLNASGLAAISKTGITKFALAVANMVDNSAPTWSGSGNSCTCDVSFADAGTNKPKLVITYTTTSIKTVNDLAQASVKTVNDLAIASVKSINGLT